ncbi:MAG: ribbon-helix-helix domain-containing protein [Dermatophilus congolensis]|nr:ribbon-helix-helix domain-containing protein [Dermatophilus congolensis]
MSVVPTSVKLTPETAAKLDRLAARTGRSKAFYLRQAIEVHIDRLIWENDLLADVADVRAGRASTRSLDEVEADLDVAD